MWLIAQINRVKRNQLLFRFPSKPHDIEKRKKWIHAIKRKSKLTVSQYLPNCLFYYILILNINIQNNNPCYLVG